MKSTPISENGIFEISEFLNYQAQSSGAVYVSGDTSGGTLTLGTKNSAAQFMPMNDGVLIAGDNVKVEHGTAVPLFVELVGAVTPNLEVRYASC